MSFTWSAELFVSDTPKSPTSPVSAPVTPVSAQRENNQAADVFHSLQVERQQFQKKLYTKWLNSKLIKAPGSPQIVDLFQDLKDGRYLLLLLQVLTGRKLKPTKGNLRLHHLNNLTLALDVLKEYKVKLIGIHNDSITNGDTTSTLGLCWNMMYHFQIVEAMEEQGGNAEEALLKWCSDIVADYSDASVKSFQPKKWRKGYTLNAIIHAFKPDLFLFSDLSKMTSVERIEHALRQAEEAFDVHGLFTAEELHNGSVDSKGLVLYVGSLYENLKDMIRPGAEEEEPPPQVDEGKIAAEALAVRLQAAGDKLIALNEKPVPELYVLPENRKVMEDLHEEIMKELDIIEEELVSLMKAIDGQENLTEDSKDEFQNQISAMAQLHADIKDKWETCKDSFFVKLDHQHAKEIVLSAKWQQKYTSIDNTLTALEGKLNVLNAETINEANAKELADSFKALNMEIELHSPTIQGDLEFGRSLSRSNKILDKTLKDTIQNDVDGFVERRSNLDTSLLDGKARVDAELEKLSDVELKEKNELNVWLKKITEVRKKLQQFEVEGQDRSSNPGKDLPLAIEEQKKLLEEVIQYKTEVDVLVSNGESLSESFSSEQKKNALLQEKDSINQLSITTLTFLEEILQRLEHDYTTQVNKELLLLKKWRERADLLDGWLVEMETYLNNMDVTDGEETLNSSRNEFETYHQKLTTEGPSMQRNIDFGNTLMKSGKIKAADNQEKLQTEINDLSLRKDQLDQQFSSGNARLVAAEEQYSMNQSKLLNLWFTKANEIKKQLRGIELKGQLANAQTKEELEHTVQFLTTLKTNVNELQPLVTDHIVEGNGLLKMTSDKEKAEELEQEIKALKAFFDTVVESIETNQDRFKKRLDGLLGEEEQLISQWAEKQKQINEDLCNIEEQIDQFAELPEDIALLESAIDEHQVFASNVATKEGEMEVSVGFGKSLLNNDRITDLDHKEAIEKDLHDYSQRKEAFHERIKDRKENLSSALDYQKKRKTGVVNAWLERAAFLRKQLKDIELKGEFANADTKDELNDILCQIEELSESLKELQPSIDSHLEDGIEVKQTTTGNKQTDVNDEIVALENSFSLTTKSLEKSRSRFQKQLDGLLGEEQLLISQWSEKQKQIHEDLCNIEEQIDQFAELPEDIAQLETAIEEHDVFASNVATKEGEMEVSVGFGKSLLNNDRITDPDHKEAIENNLYDYSQRKEAFHKRIKERKSGLLSTLDSQKKKETSELNEWYGKTIEIKSFMRKMQAEGREVSLTNVTDVQNAIARQELLIKQIEEQKKSTFDHSASGGKLLKTLSNKTKVEDLKEEVRSLLVQHKLVLDSLKNTLESYKKSLETMSMEREDNSDNLLTRLQLFHDWIKFARQQLEFVSTSQSQELHDLIQKEQGLKKLSGDMEARSDEYSYFDMMFQEFGEKDNTLSSKDQQIKGKIQEVKTEWDEVIDAVDLQFKLLYDTINSLVDERQGALEKTLASLKKKLNSIEENQDVSNENMLGKAKILSNVTEQLGKVKPQIVKLSQQTNALNEVTLFVDDEKNVMKQSSESLQFQFVGCRDQAVQLKKKIQEDIMEQITTYSTSASHKVTSIVKESVPFESINLTRLPELKHFLLHEQKLVEEIKVEHFKLDDVESFAEQIASHNIISPDDQVTLANTINTALKTVEDAQKKSKTKINKVYAVCYHTLTQNFQTLLERLKEIVKVGSELDDSVIQDFMHLKNDLASLKALRQDFDNANENEKYLRKDIDEMKEILDPSDEKQLVALEITYQDAATNCDELLNKARERLVAKAAVISARKLDEFMGWYPIMKRRSEEGSEIGPDAIAIERQLQEVKVIEQQAVYHSFSLLFDDEEGKALLQEMKPDLQKEIVAAHSDWLIIKDWLTKRKGELENARNIWEEFNSNCADLIDYLNHTERQVNTWNELDLNDDESVHEQKAILKELLVSMETRKPHMGKLNGVLGELLDLIGVEGQVATKVRSQVTDISSMWNKLIKSNIENSTKLARVHKMFLDLERTIREARVWITSTVEILRILSTEDESIEKSLKKIEEKRLEFDKNEEKLEYIVTISDTLSSDPDTTGHFTINEDIQLLDRDFQGVKTELKRLDTYLSKAFIIARRMRYTIRRKIDEVGSSSDKSITDTKENEEEEKSDIQLQNIETDNVTDDSSQNQPQQIVVN